MRMKTTDMTSGKLILLLLLLVSVPWTLAQIDTTPDAPDTTVSDTSEPSTSVDPSTPDPSTTTPDPPAPPPPPPPPKTIEAYNFEGPIDELRGSYTLSMTKHETGRPGIVSVWPINKAERNFAIYFWPPKYCHAIYLCPVKSKTYNKMNKFDEFDCDKTYIKYYPHISKIVFKKDAQSDEVVEKFYVESSLDFQLEGSGKYVLKALNQMPDNYKHWKELLMNPAEVENFEFDLDGMDLLIVTNSRMCEINKPGIGDFYAIFNSEFIDKTITDKWPKWLPMKNPMDKIPTVEMAPTGMSTKDIDMLPFLKEMTFESNKLGKTEQYCANFEKTGVFGARKPVYEHSSYVSTATYNVWQPNTQAAERTLKLEFAMNNCQWIRLWATDDEMSDYSTKMKLDDTLDIFIQEGFYLPPDSNEPIPLPDSHLINKIKLTILPETVDDNQELIEFAFGSVNEKYLFRQFFRSRSFGKKNFKLHMIRSPRCESNYIISGGFQDDVEFVEVPNFKSVQSCSYSYMKDKIT